MNQADIVKCLGAQTKTQSWHKGYVHWHTAFLAYANDPQYQVSSQQMIDDMQKLGSDFVFCAGDHGSDFGPTWGCACSASYATEKYYDYCIQNSLPDFLLIPASEIHLYFWDKPRANPKVIPQHHTLVPNIKYIPELFNNNPEEFISSMHEYNLPVILNHPRLSVNLDWSGPEPLPGTVLEEIDYLSLFEHPELFKDDFAYYLKFLSHPPSKFMGCCAGTDSITPYLRPVDDPIILNNTWLYVEGEFNFQNVMSSWRKKRTYATRGFSYFTQLEPAPGNVAVKIGPVPQIRFRVENSADKNITNVKILKHGQIVFEDSGRGEPVYSLSWQDNNPSREGSYIIYIEAEDDILVTSPINFFMDCR